MDCYDYCRRLSLTPTSVSLCLSPHTCHISNSLFSINLCPTTSYIQTELVSHGCQYCLMFIFYQVHQIKAAQSPKLRSHHRTSCLREILVHHPLAVNWNDLEPWWTFSNPKWSHCFYFLPSLLACLAMFNRHGWPVCLSRCCLDDLLRSNTDPNIHILTNKTVKEAFLLQACAEALTPRPAAKI